MREKANFKFPAGATNRLRHSASGDPTTIWREVKTGNTKPNGDPETKTTYFGNTVAQTMGGMIDDLVLVGGLKFDPVKPKVAAPALLAEWKKLLVDMNAAKIQISVGFAPQPLTGDVDAFNKFVFGPNNDPGFANCAKAMVDVMDRDLPGWAGMSFDLEHITVLDPDTGFPPTPARRPAATLECRDRLSLFYQAVCIAAGDRMVPIIAGAKIDKDHCFVHAQSGPFPAPIFALLHDWTAITALPNSTLLAMAYDGDPGGGADGRLRWHRDSIEYATTSKPKNPDDTPMIHPTKFQLLIKTGKSKKQVPGQPPPPEPGMLETSSEIEARMALAREFSVGICYFPGTPQNLATYEKLLNGSAPKPGIANGQPFQHPIADVATTFKP
ncbi:MAG: hypothetical protein H0T46_16705 [Deltaproteobacteria bacterium]|nr:hypothetical protein [Deltaproteobacteria bacterium]